MGKCRAMWGVCESSCARVGCWRVLFARATIIVGESSRAKPLILLAEQGEQLVVVVAAAVLVGVEVALRAGAVLVG
eukprot:4714475-Alexandrium_andersonii.AAC.1